MDEGYVKPVFSDVSGYGAFSVLLAVYGYTVQLFLNFSGHADMAIGIAMLLGFSLPPNFAAPFLAHNLRDFWNRWHISLSTWIRDYIYIPLGGNRGGFLRTQFNLIVAMVLSGIWHGAGWCFFIWGLVHGFGLAVLNVGDKILGGRNIFARTFLGRIFGIFVTFHFVAFAFVIFRSESFSEVVSVFNAFSVSNMYVPSLSDLIAFGIMLLCFLLYPLFIAVFNGFVSTLEKMPVEFWCVPLAAVVFFLLIVAPSGVPGFIYANF